MKSVRRTPTRTPIHVCRAVISLYHVGSKPESLNRNISRLSVEQEVKKRSPSGHTQSVKLLSLEMGWEADLTDAVYNNDGATVKEYLQQKEVRKSIGEDHFNGFGIWVRSLL